MDDSKGCGWAVVTLILLVIITAVAIKLFWAKFIYDDFRCAYAQCRIVKDGNEID